MKKDEAIVSEKLLQIYQNSFNKYNATKLGIGYPTETNMDILYSRILNVMDDFYVIKNPTVLDVGCGYGGLLEYIKKRKININYTGIDILDENIKAAKKNHPNHSFYVKDALNMDYNEEFDYVICNGIFTDKGDADIFEMTSFVKKIIKKMFKASRVGIGFNLISTYVENFYEGMFYKNPMEILAFCLSELSTHVKIDHSKRKTPDYLVYIYRENDILQKYNIKYKGIFEHLNYC